MSDLPGFGRGISRGLPSRLQTAEPARPSASSRRPGVGPLGGAAPAFAERQVESDPAKGEFEAWRHLDPSRNQKAPYIPGLHQKPQEDDWEEDNVAQAQPYIPSMDANPSFNHNTNYDGELKPRLPDAKLVSDFRSGKKNPISALTEYW